MKLSEGGNVFFFTFITVIVCQGLSCGPFGGNRNYDCHCTSATSQLGITSFMAEHHKGQARQNPVCKLACRNNIKVHTRLRQSIIRRSQHVALPTTTNIILGISRRGKPSMIISGKKNLWPNGNTNQIQNFLLHFESVQYHCKKLRRT